MYITPTEFLLYYDERRVLQLLSDTGTPISPGAVATSEVVLRAIRTASAMLDSSVQTGNRYQRAQLEDIVTASNSGSATEADKKRAEPIKSLVAHLTFGYIVSRRGYAAAKMQELAPMYAEALTMLNQLSSGLRILDIDAPKTAGVPRRVGIGTQTQSLTLTNPMFGVFGTNQMFTGDR